MLNYGYNHSTHPNQSKNNQVDGKKLTCLFFFCDPWMSKYMASHAHFNFETSYLKRSIVAKTDTDRPPNVFFAHWIKLSITSSYSDWLTIFVFYSRNVKRERESEDIWPSSLICIKLAAMPSGLTYQYT